MAQPLPHREPFVVHCGECHHEWALGFAPMLADTFAKVGKRPCPACGSRQVFMGPLPTPTAPGDADGWIGHGDTGISSETIWYALRRRLHRPGGRDVPHDPADFGRCYRLLHVMPGWRARLPEVAELCPEWAPFVAAWDELTEMYEEVLASEAKTAPKLYERLQVLAGRRP